VSPSSSRARAATPNVFSAESALPIILSLTSACLRHQIPKLLDQLAKPFGFNYIDGNSGSFVFNFDLNSRIVVHLQQKFRVVLINNLKVVFA
jgi:hypothetical protein